MNNFEDSYTQVYMDTMYPQPEPIQLAAGPSATMSDAPPPAAGSISAIPQTRFEKFLEQTGLTLEQVGMELDKIGKINIGGFEIGIRDFLPFVGSSEKDIDPITGQEVVKQVGTPQALQKLGTGVGPMLDRVSRGTGFARQLDQDAKLALFDLPTVGAALKPAAKVSRAAVNVTKDLPAGLSVKAVGDVTEALTMPVKIGGKEIKIPADQAAVLQRAVKNLTPEEQAKFRTDTAQKFVTVLQQLPSTKEFAAAAIGGKAKKGWYENSSKAILEVFGPDAPRFAALLSATSPQTSVESNLYNALQVWKNWTAAGRPTDEASIVRIMGESVQGNKGEESVLDAWINNSVRALTAEDPSQVVLSGPKVNSFMLNLQGNVQEVTNDAWMAAFTLVDQKLFAGSLTKGGDPGKGPGYIAMNARTRETAAYLTKLTGETWTPAEVQETIWSWAKTLYEKAGAAGETRTAVQLVRDNALTDELIASTPDFRTLFHDQRFQPILEQAGYAEQLDKLRAATGAVDAGAGSQKSGAGSKASTLDPEAQRKLNERNAKRLDTLRRRREEAAAQRASVQSPTGANE